MNRRPLTSWIKRPWRRTHPHWQLRGRQEIHGLDWRPHTVAVPEGIITRTWPPVPIYIDEVVRHTCRWSQASTWISQPSHGDIDCPFGSHILWPPFASGSTDLDDFQAMWTRLSSAFLQGS